MPVNSRYLIPIRIVSELLYKNILFHRMLLSAGVKENPSDRYIPNRYIGYRDKNPDGLLRVTVR